MSWSFRKTFRILPGVKVNLTRRGVSATLGASPLSLNLGPRGVYSNMSIPGTGIRNRQRIDGPSSQPSLASIFSTIEKHRPDPSTLATAGTELLVYLKGSKALEPEAVSAYLGVMRDDIAANKQFVEAFANFVSPTARDKARSAIQAFESSPLLSESVLKASAGNESKLKEFIDLNNNYDFALGEFDYEFGTSARGGRNRPNPTQGVNPMNFKSPESRPAPPMTPPQSGWTASELAFASLMLGILSLLVGLYCINSSYGLEGILQPRNIVMWLIPAIFAVILAGRAKGEKLARPGLVLGYMALALLPLRILSVTLGNL